MEQNKGTANTCGAAGPTPLSYDERLGFRDMFRQGREAALRDAEGFQQVVFAVERLGARLLGHYENLSAYKDKLKALVGEVGLTGDETDSSADWQIPFLSLFNQLRESRNDAMHQGAYARHLATHAVQLSLLLEESLMPPSDQDRRVRDLMVRDVIIAQPWHPVGFVRQAMLTNSFSYLPLGAQLPGHVKTWPLIEDDGLVLYISASNSERKRRLTARVSDAVVDDASSTAVLETVPTKVVTPETLVSEVIGDFNGMPLVVVHFEQEIKDGQTTTTTHLIGLLTAFDVL